MTDGHPSQAEFSPAGLWRLVLPARWRVRLETDRLLIDDSRGHHAVAYDEILEIRVGARLGVAGVVVTTQGGATQFPGLGGRDARALADGLRHEVRQSIAARMAVALPTVTCIAERARDFLSMDRYLSTAEFTTWSQVHLAPAIPAVQSLGDLRRHSCVDEELLPAGARDEYESIALLIADPSAALARRNKDFVARELVRRASFFDSVESTPLTAEQRDAAVVLEDHTLLVAAAGSGKSSTVVAKVGYLIEAGICDPAEILVLAFNKSVRIELEDRLAKRLARGGEVAVRTFHALGLEILGTATGRRPDVPSWASDDSSGGRVLDDIIKEIRSSDAGFNEDWVLFHTLYSAPDVQLTEFQNETEYRRYLQRAGVLDRDRRGIRTLNGELVKSRQEAVIANWLFVNGVDYRYEATYPYDTASSTHRQYRPDFYYPAADLWHEHFAVDEDGRCPRMWPDYAAGIAWKRQLHSDRGTGLFETTSAMYSRGELLPSLEARLRAAGIPLAPRSIADIDRRLQSLGVSVSADFLRTFIRHWKSNRRTVADLHANAAVQRDRPRAEAFVRVAVPLFETYNHRLEAVRGIDFEDMVNAAVDQIEAGRFLSPYRVILVDEFQDISTSRARLVEALLRQRSDSRLFAVGDDWQSIYRFAGSDASVMRDFRERFGGAVATRYLTRTFRSNQGICDVASHFVQVNPAQLRKRVQAGDPSRDGVIRVVLHNGIEERDRQLEAELRGLAREVPAGERRRAFILGRYRHLEPRGLRSWQASLRDHLEVRFLTCHRAKGLEANYVFVVGCDAGNLGFPSEQEDDLLLRLVMPAPETFRYAEERRLFYVAMTRARHRAWLFADRSRPSAFIAELGQRSYEGVVTLGATSGTSVRFCPRCNVGVLVSRSGKWGSFLGCSTYPVCEYTQSLRR